MKVPQMPPSLNDYMASLDKLKQAEYLTRLFHQQPLKPVDDKGRYAHWDKVQYRPYPDYFDSPLMYWHWLKLARSANKKNLPFKDKLGNTFHYVEFDQLHRLKDWILEHAAGALSAPEKITDKPTKESYLIGSMIEEAINSSQMEGASTTRRVAKDMLLSEREPKDISEQMIVNNYRAMLFIKDLLKDNTPLTKEIIFELHKVVTEKTLSGEDKGKEGQFRTAKDPIIVCDPNTDNILHTPPNAAELPDRLQLICDFVNEDPEEANNYLPPVIRAIIVHFMMGYDHPFVEGNGRTARALFYWIIMKSNYWLMEFISISSVIKRSQRDYLAAYVHSETDENDLTYFIVHQLEVIKKAIEEFHRYVADRVERDNNVLELFKHSEIKKKLNFRQVGVIRNALKNPGNVYTIQSHKNSHNCSTEIARRDLLALSDEYGLINKFKQGRTYVFVAPNDLGERIKTK